ncbi:MAG: Maf family protein [archaeon]
MDFILASESPRRKKLLLDYGFKFKVIPSEINEKKVPYKKPSLYVKKLAYAKALAVFQKNTNSVVFGADTIVVLEGKLIGKPKNNSDAKKILHKLSGKKHYVYTGFCILDGNLNKKIVGYSKSCVKFKKLDGPAIDNYLKNENALDKAGGYNAEDKSSKIFIDFIKGSKTNVVGLPMDLVVLALRKIGIKAKKKAH